MGVRRVHGRGISEMNDYKELCLHELSLFCDVARHQSFSQAASEHGITQSAASQRVGQLEKRLDTRLLDRSVRPLELTEAGRVVLREGLDLLERSEKLRLRVARLQGPAQGIVRVDAIYSAGIDLLSRVKDAYEKGHGSGKMALEYRRPDEVYDAVKHERCDLGIISYPQRWRDVEVIPLRDEPMVVICAPDHSLAQHHDVHVSALNHLPMIAFEPSLPVARHVRTYFREHSVNPEVTNVFDNIDTIKSAVAVTGGLAIVPKRTVLREVEAGGLTAIDLNPRLSRPMGVISRRRGGRAFRATVQEFIDLLLEHAGPDHQGESADEPGRQLVGEHA